MKVSLKNIWESGASLQRLASREDVEPEALNWKIMRVYQGAESELKTLQKSHAKLRKKYGKLVKDAAGNEEYTLSVHSDNFDAFEAEWDAVLNVEVELWGDPIKRQELEKVKMLPIDRAALFGWLIVE